MDHSKVNDVCLFYNKADKAKADGIRKELDKLNVTVQSYPEFIAGTGKLNSRTELIQKSWTVGLIVTDDFVKDSMNEYEAEVALVIGTEIERQMVVPVKYCDDLPGIMCHLNEVEGKVSSIDQIAKKLQGNVEYNKQQQANKTTQDNPLPDRAHKILKFISDLLIKVFQMDQKMKDLIQQLGIQKNARADVDWIKLINEKIQREWKQGRGKGLYFEKNVSLTMKDKHPEVVSGLDGPKGYLCLAFLLSAGSKQPLRDFNNYANLEEYLDTEAILELLKRCPVFPSWNESQKKAFDNLTNDRIQDAHQPVSNTADGEQQLVDSTAKSAKEAVDVLIVSHFQMEIERLGAAPNQAGPAP